MVDDITELQSTAERIAENEDKIKAVEAIRDKVLVAQNNRAEHANNRQPSSPQYSRER